MPSGGALPILSAADAMALAIAEAQKGWGRVSPNPLVGCVIVDCEGRLLATGHHAYEDSATRKPGPHAEIAALEKITDKTILNGATAYVTLEPCSHPSKNKKAPCAEVLSQYPFRKVVYGLKDPNPMVNGGGEKFLRDRGIEAVSVSEDTVQDAANLQMQLEDLAEQFLTDMREGRAFVALKVATTADGFMADKVGPTKWITNEISRQHVHYLRAGYDAILVGKNTFLKDDPALNVRHADYRQKTLKVIVADSKGEGLPRLAESTLYKSHDSQNIYWIVDNPGEHAAFKHLNINLVAGPVQPALKVFYEMGVKSIFVEGGSEIYSYFIKNNLVDRLYHYVSPNKFEGSEGLHWLEGLSNHENPLHFTNTKKLPMGPDVLRVARVR